MTEGTKQDIRASAADSKVGVPDASSAPIRPGSPATSSTSALLDRVYVAFCDRTAAGEQLDPEAYCAQFPALQSSLPRLLRLHRFLEKNWADSPDDQDIRWPAPGETFLDYRLILELGEGAFARVFLASEPKLGNRLVAVKIAWQGGKAEAQTLGRLQHPNIAPVYSVAENRAAGLTLVCMPYLGSATLHNVLDRVKLQTTVPTQARLFLEAANDLAHPLEPAPHAAPPDATLETGTYLDGVRWLGAQMADALAFIHEKGVCHLDLKPSNVLLSPAGTPLLLDFNLASDSRRDRHRLGGTFPYMSPEQLHASDRDALPAAIAAVGAKSDLYSLGVLLYQLATGVHPLGQASLKLSEEELRTLILERQRAGFAPVRQVNADVDPVFADLIERCLANDPARRPPSAAAIASVLRHDLKPVARAQRWVARNPRKTLAGLVLVALLGVAGVTSWGLSPPASERHFAAGMECYQSGDFAAAREHLTQAVQADLTSAKAFFARGRALQKLGATDRTQFNLAMEDLQKAQELAPAGRNLAAIGYCFHLLGQKPAALHKYRQGEAAGFVNAALSNNIGVCLMQTGNPAEAHTYLTQAIEWDGAFTLAYENRAILLTDLASNRIAELEHLDKNPDGAHAFDQKKKRAELAAALTGGQHDIEKALALGPPSGEMSFRAACFYAVASHVEPAHKKDALRHLATAVATPGFDASQLQANRRFAALKDDPQFQAWSALPAPERPTPPPARFTDPITDLVP